MPNWTIASVKYFYLTYYIAALCKVFLLDKISYNLTCKNAEYPSYSNISQYPLAWGIFYIIKHLFDCETSVMCSTHTSRSKSHITYHTHPLHHKLYQIPAQFTQNPQIDFDTRFDKTLIFPSKTKLSDNLKI